jgi:hypothetical protein
MGLGKICWGDWIFRVETHLIRPIRASYFSNPVSEFPLTYRSELIDEDFSVEGEELILPTAAVSY